VKQELEDYFRFLTFYVNACKLSNPSVGDAICVFLLFELALFYLKKDYRDTLKLYQDLESLTSKIGVKAKENLRVTQIEDKVVEPAGLQAQIEAVLEKHKGKKAFLRASGTENVLRLHV
jgi:phosphoacetylglucosamine mutase